MKVTEQRERLPPVVVTVVPAESDEELQAAALLRARSFYVYPKEREFSGALHKSCSSPYAVWVDLLALVAPGCKG